MVRPLNEKWDVEEIKRWLLSFFKKKKKDRRRRGMGEAAAHFARNFTLTFLSSFFVWLHSSFASEDSNRLEWL